MRIGYSPSAAAARRNHVYTLQRGEFDWFFFFPSIVIHFVPSSLQPIIVVYIVIVIYYFYCAVYAKRHCVCFVSCEF